MAKRKATRRGNGEGSIWQRPDGRWLGQISLGYDEEGKLKSSGELLLVVFLVIGTFAGELLKLDERFSRLCKKIENKFNTEGFSAGFING